MEYNKQGHAVYYVRYHVVIATRYRRKVLKGGMGEYLKRTIREISRYYPEIYLIEVNTDIDHVHLLISIPPKMSVSQVVNIIKSNIGKAMREKYDFLRYVYFGGGGIWSAGYFVSTVGINEEIIRRYIEQQGKEDRGQTKFEF